MKQLNSETAKTAKRVRNIANPAMCEYFQFENRTTPDGRKVSTIGTGKNTLLVSPDEFKYFDVVA